MASLGEEYNSAWDLMENAHKRLKEKYPENTWLQYWDGQTFQIFPAMIAIGVIKDSDKNATIKEIIALGHYYKKLDAEWQS